MTRGEIIRHNGWQTIVSLDQALHCLGGLLSSLLLACIRAPALPVVWADETLSSHCWRWHLYGIRSWPCRLVDALFWWQKAHCRSAYESERDGRQLPPELRSL
ncbi:pseudouridine synthase [Desulfovibrio piger]|uniref:pseudouridine synthase n=1 Tax=Desulfovibrio piger TaxID=901 RepID=UPI00242CA873|nr:pseudouridine synthase [Desulfovibrio piger]MCI7506820.1 pseudouridine synthase [Desulfovibrio piger]